MIPNFDLTPVLTGESRVIKSSKNRVQFLITDIMDLPALIRKHSLKAYVFMLQIRDSLPAEITVSLNIDEFIVLYVYKIILMQENNMEDPIDWIVKEINKYKIPWPEVIIKEVFLMAWILVKERSSKKG